MKSNEALKRLLQAGWERESQKGSHIKLVHKNYKHKIIFPFHGSKEIGTGLWNKIKKQAGI